MTIKAILFNGEMVRAILDGRKTQTRRIAFKHGDLREFRSTAYPEGWWYKGRVYKSFDSFLRDRQGLRCMYAPGDILYVREAWSVCGTEIGKDGYSYMADDYPDNKGFGWRPSINMPREAARIFLRVKDVRVERLQDITTDQANAEGCDGRCLCPSSGTDGSMCTVERDFSVERFETLWDSTIKKADLPSYDWRANPWVWVIEFERCEKPEGWPD